MDTGPQASLSLTSCCWTLPTSLVSSRVAAAAAAVVVGSVKHPFHRTLLLALSNQTIIYRCARSFIIIIITTVEYFGQLLCPVEFGQLVDPWRNLLEMTTNSPIRIRQVHGCCTGMQIRAPCKHIGIVWLYMTNRQRFGCLMKHEWWTLVVHNLKKQHTILQHTNFIIIV